MVCFSKLIIMNIRPELYFKNDTEWRTWLAENYDSFTGIYLILYRVDSAQGSMRWEEAVRVALCYGWIDSTVKKLDDERRRQLFTPCLLYTSPSPRD